MTNPIKYTVHIGCIVECIHNDKIVLGVVEDISSSSCYIYTSTKREIKINENRILPWVHTCTEKKTRNEYDSLLQKTLRIRELYKQELITTIHELWECIADEVTVITVQDLAELAFTNPTIEHIASTGRVMLESKEYFKFTPPLFEVYTKKQYWERKKIQEIAFIQQQKFDAFKKIVAFAMDSLQSSTSHNTLSSTTTPDIMHLCPVEEEYKRDFIHLLHAKRNHNTTQEEEKLWREITTTIQEQEYLIPIILGQALGILPKHYNIFANKVGYSIDNWEEKYIETIQEISSVQTEHEYIDIPFISIDNSTTKDIDDAFHVEMLDAITFRIHFAIALPVEHWDYTSSLHKEVSTRATSLYLPEGTYNMLPNIFAEERYSITAGSKKNILYIHVDMNNEGDILDTTLRIATSTIAENITYEECEERLKYIDNPSYTWLQKAYDLAVILQEKRLNNGGILIQREEKNILLVAEDGTLVTNNRNNADGYSSLPNTLCVSILPQKEYKKSQLLVSEFMILANKATVNFAKNNKIPLIHRVQECSTPTGSQRIWERPEEIHSVMKMLTSVSLDVLPKRHSALGILGYATITSPLRRYVDFINEEQIFSWCIHGESRYSEDALSSLIPLIQQATEQSLSVQRSRIRYWKLTFLKQLHKDWIEGIFVEENGSVAFIYLPNVQITVKTKRSLFGEKAIIGDTVEVRLGTINPLLNDIHIVEIR